VQAAREGARALQRISSEGRRDILLAMAQTLQDREEEVR
jgi:gamma-glutamyl phosphate reductase